MSIGKRERDSEDSSNSECNSDSESRCSKKIRYSKGCCECGDVEEYNQFVVGIGSAESEMFPFPTKNPEIVQLCEGCEANHGEQDYCDCCQNFVIGPMFMKRCRMCLPESKIWEVLREKGVDRQILEHEEAKYLEGNVENEQLYAIFFGKDGNTPPAGIMQIVKKSCTKKLWQDCAHEVVVVDDTDN